ncbi:hypothetical protein [Bosea caraganae]|uniref:hypothetical protein n=1 Tax=Bosea caraganae TaxID=2763117 RepID=UPI0011C01DB9|nr:hypothetical protein [Bosea caraganae]
MKVRGREKDIVARAEAASEQLLELEPPGKSQRKANAERIVALCREFVQQRPSRQPTSAALAELGRIRYGRFPAEQTMLNYYRQFLAIWRKAHLELVSAQAPRPRSDGSILDPDSLRRLDAGTKAQIDQLQIILREQKRENDRLRTIIGKTVPAPVPGKAVIETPPAQAKLIHRWLLDLEKPNHLLSVDEAGVRVTRLGSPGRIIMDVNVLDAVVELSGHERLGRDRNVR